MVYITQIFISHFAGAAKRKENLTKRGLFSPTEPAKSLNKSQGPSLGIFESVFLQICAPLFLLRSGCQMYCWAQYPVFFGGFLGVTLDSAETAFAKPPFYKSPRGGKRSRKPCIPCKKKNEEFCYRDAIFLKSKDERVQKYPLSFPWPKPKPWF